MNTDYIIYRIANGHNTTEKDLGLHDACQQLIDAVKAGGDCDALNIVDNKGRLVGFPSLFKGTIRPAAGVTDQERYILNVWEWKLKGEWF